MPLRDAPLHRTAASPHSGACARLTVALALSVALSPVVVALRSSYPDPFAGQRTTGDDLADPVYVPMAVSDAVGQRVATLVDEAQTTGHFEVEWEASPLASRVYVYRIVAGSFTETHKVSLVR